VGNVTKIRIIQLEVVNIRRIKDFDLVGSDCVFMVFIIGSQIPLLHNNLLVAPDGRVSFWILPCKRIVIAPLIVR
jgi:hypothetical protein